MPEQQRRRAGTSSDKPPSRRSVKVSTRTAPAEEEAAGGHTGPEEEAAGGHVGPEEAAHSACHWLRTLISHRPEGVSAVRRTEQGWCVAVDVLEVPRIPDTTSLLATYEVEIDEDGELAEYRRVRRYRRGTADD